MRWQGEWRWRAAKRRYSNSMHRHTFGKNMGHIEEIIRVDRVFRFRHTTSYALILVSFQASNFEENGQAVNLLLAVTFLGNRSIASQFLGGISGLGGRT